ncbi:hypothetical protein VNO77_38937 [Canavalia gladiata]|uniref:Uncharacterized protein n=1 Tax=Canavalia gladiata TaxID=3824 RepID=A0AAN9PXB0_CANGL
MSFQHTSSLIPENFRKAQEQSKLETVEDQYAFSIPIHVHIYHAHEFSVTKLSRIERTPLRDQKNLGTSSSIMLDTGNENMHKVFKDGPRDSRMAFLLVPVRAHIYLVLWRNNRDIQGLTEAWLGGLR